MQATPPPEERFDPFLERWVTPGGPLHDPARDAVDPHHCEPVELVEPVPPELRDATRSAPLDANTGRQRHRGSRSQAIAGWLVAAALAVALAAVILASRIGYCPETGTCAVAYGGGPAGWVTAALLLGFAVHAGRRAYLRRR
ncbi:MAG TPA: hypothetical protein VGK18_03700 [Propionicimonas sp.]|uniref:hypothetical protein n=1 Tax=Propionicimonas sp. TaxID=1955623 RepID=UPI002F3FF411